MSSPLPPDLAAVERLLEASRSPLPEALRAKVLAAASKAVPAVRERPLSPGWFAGAVAMAAALLLNFSNSAAVLPARPVSGQLECGPVSTAALLQALLSSPDRASPPDRPSDGQAKE